MSIPPLIRFDVWVAALTSGFTPLDRFIAWADQRILSDSHQPRWMLDLSLGQTVDEADGMLRLEWSRQSEFPVNQVPELNEPGKLYIGFLYLMFADGRLSMAEMLKKAGMYTDGQGYDAVDKDCETFFYLLNEIDGGGPTVPSDGPLAERVDELFAPFAAMARATLCELPANW